MREGFDVVLLSRDEASKVVHPCEKPFYLLSLLVAAQLAQVPSARKVGTETYDLALSWLYRCQINP